MTPPGYHIRTISVHLFLESNSQMLWIGKIKEERRTQKTNPIPLVQSRQTQRTWYLSVHQAPHCQQAGPSHTATPRGSGEGMASVSLVCSRVWTFWGYGSQRYCIFQIQLKKMQIQENTNNSNKMPSPVCKAVSFWNNCDN